MAKSGEAAHRRGCSRRGCRCRTGAFTLPELLIVIAVMLILVALLLPVLGYARFQARAVTCTSQFRQWGIACGVYAADNAGWLPRHDIPPTGCGGNAWDVGNELLPSLELYGVTWQLWWCPLDGPPPGIRDRTAALAQFHRWEDPTGGPTITWDHFMIIPLNWWVPRQQPAGSAVPIFPFPESNYPTRLSDLCIGQVPILTDKINQYTNQYALPVPALVDGGHRWQGRLHSLNELFADGRVERVAAAKVLHRYTSMNMHNFY
jgi:prepilin-type N-terminal cleavage/methylation domain-containing protein